MFRIVATLLILVFPLTSYAQSQTMTDKDRLVSGWWGGYAKYPIGITIGSDGYMNSARISTGILDIRPPIQPNEFGVFERVYEGRLYQFVPVGRFYVANEWDEGDHTGVAVLRDEAPNVPRDRKSGWYSGRWGGGGDRIISIEVDENGHLSAYHNGRTSRAFRDPIPPINDHGTLHFRRGLELWSFVPIEQFFVAYYNFEGQIQELAVLEESDAPAEIEPVEEFEESDMDTSLYSGVWVNTLGESVGSPIVIQLLDSNYLMFCLDTNGSRELFYRCELLPYIRNAEDAILLRSRSGTTKIELSGDGWRVEYRESGLETFSLRAELTKKPWCAPQVSQSVNWLRYRSDTREVKATRSGGVVEFKSGMINIDKRPTFDGNYRVRVEPVGSSLSRLRQSPTDMIKVYVVPTSATSAQVGLWHGERYRLTGKLTVSDDMLAQAWLIHLDFLEDRVGQRDIDGQFGPKSRSALEAYSNSRGEEIGSIKSFLKFVSKGNPRVSPWCKPER